MLRTKTFTLTDTLSAVEMELRNCREQLEKTVADRESLKRQMTSYILEIDRLKQVISPLHSSYTLKNYFTH